MKRGKKYRASEHFVGYSQHKAGTGNVDIG